MWEQALDVIDEVMDDGYKENLAQFLNCPEYVIEKSEFRCCWSRYCRLSLRVCDNAKILFENPIASPDSTEYLLSCEWEFEGLDVADANGYFSLFDIDSGAQKLGSGGRFSN